MNKEKGQALVEYVVLLAILAGIFAFLFRYFPALLTSVEKPLQTDFKYAYRYGDKKARGYEDDGNGPQNHPRIFLPGNFRLFGRGR